MANAASTRMTGSPINISASTLRLNFDDLVEMLTATFEKCGKQGRRERRSLSQRQAGSCSNPAATSHDRAGPLKSC